MITRRFLGLLCLLLASAACSGSGSSGFDAGPGEAAAIQQALDQQRCVTHGKLTICPADAAPAAPPSSTPTPTATRTPIGVVPTAAATPGLSPTPTPAHTAVPAGTTTATAAATATPAGMRIDTALDLHAPIPCVPTTSGCSFVFPFVPQGFPPTAVFRVAIRSIDASPSTIPWTIGADVSPSGPAGTSDFEASITLAERTPDSIQSSNIQLAILVFLAPPSLVPPSVRELSDSGAAFAFVTTELTLQPVR